MPDKSRSDDISRHRRGRGNHSASDDKDLTRHLNFVPRADSSCGEKSAIQVATASCVRSSGG